MHTALRETRLRKPHSSNSLHAVRIIPPVLAQKDIEQLLALPCAASHHDSDGHHAANKKPTALPWVAEKLWPAVVTEAQHAWHVDPMMKLYRLQAGEGAVAPHQDLDYEGPGGLIATHSIILFLNKGYEGGETLFEGVALETHPEVGGGLLFPHSLMHEGREVIRGTKFVLKTDLFTHPRT